MLISGCGTFLLNSGMYGSSWERKPLNTILSLTSFALFLQLLLHTMYLASSMHGGINCKCYSGTGSTHKVVANFDSISYLFLSTYFNHLTFSILAIPCHLMVVPVCQLRTELAMNFTPHANWQKCTFLFIPKLSLKWWSRQKDGEQFQ